MNTIRGTLLTRVLYLLFCIIYLSSCEERQIYHEQMFTILDTPYSVRKQVYENTSDNKVVLTLYKDGKEVDFLTWRAFTRPLDSGNYIDLIFDKDSVYTSRGLYVEDSNSDSPVFVNLDNKQEDSYYYCILNRTDIYGRKKKRILTCDMARAAESNCYATGKVLRIHSHSNDWLDVSSYRIMGLRYDANDELADRNIPFAFSNYVDIPPKFMGTDTHAIFENWLKQELMKHWEETRVLFEPTGEVQFGFWGHFYFVLSEEGEVSYLNGHKHPQYSIIKDQIMKSSEYWQPGYKNELPIKTIVHFDLYSFGDTLSVKLAQ